ncbi:Uncharacterised protein [Vibrio cholerae]|uniref:Uncharacterized protein n=1 Tax=Vibrio cholerae TaxID=666 RepID=A0A655WEU4_VIBCL|nr:Uncharacterised protein [Vibrio cholerae]
MQSSIKSSTLPYGLKYKPSLDLFGRLACRYLIGDGTLSRIKRRWPARIALSCSCSVSNSLISTLSFLSTNAG